MSLRKCTLAAIARFLGYLSSTAPHPRRVSERVTPRKH